MALPVNGLVGYGGASRASGLASGSSLTGVWVYGCSAAAVILVLVACAFRLCVCALCLYLLFGLSSLLALLLALIMVLALCWPCVTNPCPLLPLCCLPLGGGQF